MGLRKSRNGTSEFEDIDADEVIAQALESDTLIAADVLNASENQILVTQGDGTLAAETQAQGPNPYDQAQSFTESEVTVTTTDTTVSNGSIEIAGGSQLGVWVDDWEDGDISGWTGDTGSLTNQTSIVLTGSKTGKLTSSNAQNAVDSPSVGSSTTNAFFTQRVDNVAPSTSDNVDIRFYNTSDTQIAAVRFEGSSRKVQIVGSDSEELWSANTSHEMKIQWDFANDQFDFIFDGTNTGTYPLQNSSSSWDYIEWQNTTTNSGETINAYLDNRLNPLTAGSATIEWNRAIPTDIFEWEMATFTRTLDGETVDVFVAYSDDGGSTWTRTNSGNPVNRNYSLNEDANISSDVDVRIETELSRADTANNPTLDSAYRSWLV